MAILNKIQVKGVQYEIEDSNAIHGTLKTVNGTSLHGDGDIVTVGKVTEQNGEIFNDYENNTANGTYSSSIGNSTVKIILLNMQVDSLMNLIVEQREKITLFLR